MHTQDCISKRICHTLNSSKKVLGPNCYKLDHANRCLTNSSRHQYNCIDTHVSVIFVQ